MNTERERFEEYMRVNTHPEHKLKRLKSGEYDWASTALYWKQWQHQAATIADLEAQLDAAKTEAAESDRLNDEYAMIIYGSTEQSDNLHKQKVNEIAALKQQLTEADRRGEELKVELEQLAGKMIAAENLGTDVDGYDGYGAAAAIRDLLRRSATSKRGDA
jgi:predicted RNase H-like nuclease (RuvC/YqgF family)